MPTPPEGPGVTPDPQIPPGEVALQNLRSAKTDSGAPKYSEDQIAQIRTQITANLVANNPKLTPDQIAAYWGDGPRHVPLINDVAQRNPPPQAIAHGPLDNFVAGIRNSATSMLFNGDLGHPTPNSQGSWNEVLTAGAGQFLGDLPVSIAGAFGGGAAGAAVPFGGETGVTELVGAGGGAAGAPSAIRNAVIAYRRLHGTNPTPGEIVSTVFDAAKKTAIDTTIGAISAPVGGAAGGKVLGATGSKLLSVSADAAVTGTTNIGLQAAVQQQIPQEQDWASAVLMVVGALGGHYVAGRFVPSAAGKRVMKNIEDQYAQTGKPPLQIAQEASADPAKREELLGQDAHGSPVMPRARLTGPDEPPGYGKKVPITRTPEFYGGVDHAMGIIRQLESGGMKNPDAAVSRPTAHGNALGRFQIMPGTARHYMGADFDVSTLHDPAVAERVARTIISDLYRRAHGDEAAVLVGYNAGPERMNEYLTAGAGTRLEAVRDPEVHGGIRYIKVPSARDESFLPMETQQYMAKARMHAGKDLPGGGAAGAREGENESGETPAEEMERAQAEDQKRLADYEIPEGQGDAAGRELARITGDDELAEGGGGGEEPPGGNGRVPFEPMEPEDAYAKMGENIVSEKRPGFDWLKNLSPAELDRNYMTSLAPAEEIDRQLAKSGAINPKEDMTAKESLAQMNASRMRAAVAFKYGGVRPQFEADGSLNMQAPFIIDPNIPAAKDAFKEAAKNGGTESNWTKWMLARRVYDLAKRGIKTGFTGDDEGKIAVASILTNKKEAERYEKATDMLNQNFNSALDYAVAMGLYSPERAQAMKDLNPTYLAMKAAEHAPQAGTPSSSGFRTWDPLRKIDGNEGQIVSPLHSTVRSQQNIYRAADANYFGAGFFVRLAERGDLPPDVFSKVTDVAIPDVDANLPAILKEAQDKGVDPADTTEDMFNPYALMEKAGVKIGPDQVPYFRNGKLEIWKAASPEVADLIKGTDTPLKANLLGETLKVAGKIQRGGVASNPFFALGVSIFHDFQVGGVDPLHPVPMLPTLWGALKVFGNDQSWAEFQARGGGGAAMVEQNVDHVVKDLSSVFNKTGVLGALKNSVTFPFASRWFAERVDASGRMGYDGWAQMLGKSPMKATSMSREARLDFAQKGADALGQMIYQGSPFLHGWSLGTRQVGKAFLERPITTTMFNLLYTTVPVLGLAWLAMNQDQDLPEERKYANIPRWVKDSHIIFPEVSGFRMMVPLPPLLGPVFGGAPSRYLEYYQTNNPQAFDGLGQDIMTHLLPLQAEGVLHPIIENWSNKSMVTGAPLVPSSLAGLSGPMQYTESTSPTAIALDRVLGPAYHWGTGGEMSPIHIQNLIRGWGGTTGAGVLSVLDIPVHAAMHGGDWFGPTAEFQDNPFMRSFLARNPRMEAQPIADFYTVYDKVQRARGDLREAEKRMMLGDPYAAEEFAQAQTNPAAALDLVQTSVGLRRARLAIEAISNSSDMSNEEKRQQIDRIYEQSIAIARQGAIAAREVLQ